ncbi:MAG: hypothetical protein Q8L86_04310 [Vicinamibacterales bacterium]|nr:hypothetical protein [Vicinamibacterales bacterium]
MRLSRIVLALLTGLILGTAGWVSLGVLDQLPMDGQMTRVALLPPWWAWAGLVLAATLAAAGLDRLVASRAPADPEAGAWWLLPLLAVAVLVIPFLPWVADRWPLWQVLAGPARWLVWAAVGGQLAWVAWQHGWIRAPRAMATSLTTATALVWLAVFLASGWSAWRLTSTTQFPTGDEPHYLIIAQSLWRDGDLKIENNHDRGDFREYFGGALPPHYLTRGVDGEIYSIHPIGMPLLVAPVYAAGGYPLVVFLFVVIASTAATLMWRATAAWVGDRGAAVFGWAAVAFSAPFLLNTLTIYPEIPAALSVMLAFTLAARGTAPHGAPGWRWLAGGLAVATLPWFSTKYAPMSAALAVVLVARAWTAWTPWPRLSPMPQAWRASALVAAPYALSLAGWFAFFQAYWGAPWPSGPYGELVQTTPLNLWFGAPGLLFDQEYGLLPYAPALALAAPGLWRMLDRGGDHRRLAIEILLVFGALFGTVGAFRIWWGGSAVVGRPIVSGLLLLALPIAVQFTAAPKGSARRAAQHLLLCIGGAITVMLVAAQNGMLVGNHRDGTSALLAWLSPRWELWSRVPTFVQGHTDVAAAWVESLVWVGIALVAALWLGRVRARSAGHAALAALVTVAAGLLTGVWAMGLLPDPVGHPAANLQARAELAALNGFDRTRRPLGVVYDPFRVTSTDILPPAFILAVEPGARTDAQPLRLLFNGRFSLPAGRYQIAVRWNDTLEAAAPVTLDLQVGRSGPEWRSWTVRPIAGAEWTEAITLPVNALLVGFRGTPELEAVVRSIAIRPLAVVDESARVPTPDVMGAATYGDIEVFFHDGITNGEPHGFWAFGSRTTEVTIALPAPGLGLHLRVHSGETSNRVTLTVAGWSRTLDLVAGEAQELEIPASEQAVLPMTITTEGGFVPAEVNPASQDHRHLGAWFEIRTKP